MAADWAVNARAAGTGTLTAEEARPVLRAFPREVPVGVAFAKRSGMVHEGTPDEFEALAGRISVFRFEPA